MPGIGPSSTRVIAEVLEGGDSPTVEQAIDAAGKRADITKRRELRSNFLSRAAVRHVLADRLSEARPVRLSWRPADALDVERRLHDVYRARQRVRRPWLRLLGGDRPLLWLAIAGGMSMTDVTKQHHEIDRLNAGATHFHLFKGIEANMAPTARWTCRPGTLFASTWSSWRPMKTPPA